MEKTNQNLLQKLTQILNVEKIISPEDIQEIRGVLVGVLANNKKEVEVLTTETRELVNKVLNKVLDEHDTYLEKTKQIAQEAKSDTTEAIQATMKSLEEVKKLCKEVMDCKPENGKDADEEYVIGEVLNRIKLPEYKEVVLDDGGAIVDKINALPVNEENQIDAKHIKNLPEVKGGRVISGGVTRKIVEQMIAAAGGGSSPGGSTTQLQYNNAGSFGGISGATTDGTAVTYTANNLIAADVTASSSAGLLLQANNGTDVVLLGAGGGAGATFYGGVTLNTMTVGSVLFAGTSGLISQDNSNFFWDDTNNRLGIGTNTPSYKMDILGASAGATLNLLRVGNSGATTNSAATILITGGGGWDTSLTSMVGTGFIINSIYDTIFKTNGTERMRLVGSGANSGNFGLATNAPTHTLTLGYTSTGIALYNTADQTTNYERVRQYWSGNIFTIGTEQGGTGGFRGLTLSSGNSITQIKLSSNSSPAVDFVRNATNDTTGPQYRLSHSGFTAASGIQTLLSLTPTINQASTAGYTALLVNPTETTIGNGTKLLADFQVGGVSKFSVSNAGATLIVGADSTRPLAITTSLNAQNAQTGIVFSYNSLAVNTIAAIDAKLTATNNGTLIFSTGSAGGLTERVRIDTVGTGFGVTVPTAIVHLKAGTATASTAPLKFTSGTNLTTPENGAIEYDGTNFYATPSGAVRQTVNLFYNNALTATANAATVPIAYRVTTVTNNSAAALTITMTTAGAVDGQMTIVRIKDFSAVAQTITWVNTENSTVTAPVTSNGSTTLPLTVGFQYNSATSKWRCIASA